MYKAERPGSQLRVYNLWYSNSLESDRYAASLVREQRVFEELISQKAYMVLPDLVQVCRALWQYTSCVLMWNNCFQT